MMAAGIFGGVLFGSIALVADGLHMSTHAGALLLAAMAYRYARFTFGTGKFGDLAGFTGTIVLAMIALLIAYEAVLRLIDPVAIDYNETIAIAIAVLGLGVNLASVWLRGTSTITGTGMKTMRRPPRRPDVGRDVQARRSIRTASRPVSA